MTARFNLESKAAAERIHGQDMPLVKFPFISALVTGKHTELILTRGVGLHTILGMTIDVAVGECLDKASILFKRYENILKNEEL
jgi:tRNA A37 threonylcarbamoyltransferase TsaD